MIPSLTPVNRTVPVPTEIQSAHLFDRIMWARQNLKRVSDPTYCVVWEDPDDPDAPAKITHPAPEWLAMALNGGLLPPIDAYLADKRAERDWMIQMMESGFFGLAFSFHEVGGAQHPYAAPTGPMTEEEAIEYLTMKDLPLNVWETETNRPRFAIMKRADLPTRDGHRNAWRLNDLARAA